MLARSLCLYYLWDLARVPAARRNSALQQQVTLHAPFTEPGFYVRWQGGMAQVWVWDQAALCSRLPEAAHTAVVPESLLSMPGTEGERMLKTMQGAEQQHWQNGTLQDSRWLAQVPAGAQALDFQARTPLQAADRQQLHTLALAGVALLMMLALLWQGGAALRQWQQLQTYQSQLQQQDDSVLRALHARRQAEQLRRQYAARQPLLQPGQAYMLPALLARLPETVTELRQYQYQPGRVQLTLVDSNPDPRDYVTRLDDHTLGAVRLAAVQVQLERNDQLRLQAELKPATKEDTGQ